MPTERFFSSMRRSLLLCAGATALLAACGGGSPPMREALPPGADRQISASNQLPAPPVNQPHDPAIAPTDDTHGARVGSVIGAQGGQKAQKEKLEHAAAEARAQRNRQHEQEARDVAATGAGTIPPVQ